MEIAFSVAAFVTACYAVLTDPTAFLLDRSGLLLIGLTVLTILIPLHLTDRDYSIVRAKMLLVRQICLALGTAFIAQSIASFFSRSLRLPARVMLEGGFLAGALLFLLRVVFLAIVHDRSEGKQSG